MGTDSAPHPRHAKETSCGAAGVFTGPYVLAYLANALDSFGAMHCIDSFACENGRKFYGMSVVTSDTPKVKLVKTPFIVPAEIEYVDDEGITRTIVPYMANKTLQYSVEL